MANDGSIKRGKFWTYYVTWKGTENGTAIAHFIFYNKLHKKSVGFKSKNEVRLLKKIW